MWKPFWIGLFAALWALPLFAQSEDVVLAQLDSLKEQADQYTELLLFEQAMAEWTKARELAEENELTERYLNASISMAELFRKTGDYRRALEILTQLEASKNFPRTHVRKLGRLAAVHHEKNFDDTGYERVDTVRHYTEKALGLARGLHFREEEASLTNELGYLYIRNIDLLLGMDYLKESAHIFSELKDTVGYVGTMIHVVDGYHKLGETKREDSTARELVKLLENGNWYTAKIDLYNIIAHSALKRGDSMKYYRWHKRMDDELENHFRAVSNRQMAALRVFHDTKKYQDEAQASKNQAQLKSEQLERELVTRQRLTVFLSILSILALLVIGLFIRERRIKAKMDEINKALNVANEKYQMLMVESNHRIKNNLQMVISMLKYTSKEMDPGNTGALKRVSSKIHTISALHKHLYMEVHNERVFIGTYFEEIIGLYEEIAPEQFVMEKAIAPLQIESERIVYFGLIFNEMLSNTLEHRKKGHQKVQISIEPFEDRYTFRYKDGADFETERPSGTGSQLIVQLIKRVGGKHLLMDTSQGLYQFTFNV